MRSAMLFLALLLIGIPAVARGQNYVYGTFSSNALSASSQNQLFDDGLHGDGAANDGVFGADIVVDQPAGLYTWHVNSAANDLSGWIPTLWCSPPGTSSYHLWTSGPGDVVHFRGTGSDVWAMQDFACNRGLPPGATLDLLFGPYVGYYPDRYPAAHVGNGWEKVLTVPANAYSLQFAFATPDNSDILWTLFNATPSCDPFEVPYPTLGPSATERTVLFRFDELTGKCSATLVAPTATRSITWGTLKSQYR